jgi:para-aminobenzoate synthetase component 1
VSTTLCLPVPAGPALTELAATLPDERWPMLLDSGDRPGPLARWHLLVFDPVETLALRAGIPGGEGALGVLERRLRAHWPAASAPAPGMPAPVQAAHEPGLPAFRGGAVGYLGYELARELERLPARALPDADIPDALLGLYPFALAEEVPTGRRLVVGRGTERAAERFRAAVLAASARARPLPAPRPARGPVSSSLGREAYIAAVERAREHILDGDVYQVNLAQRFALDYVERLQPLQAALRRGHGTPYGALLRTPGVSVLSGSPECFLRRRGALVESRPIKGTRPRGADPDQDRALRAELEQSAKEQAELAMIVDLVRNDLGRVASVGSVEVREAAATDAWPTVFHRVATVAAAVDPGLSVGQLLRATLPPASVTGTPKIRACELIDALEPVRRHVYTGAIGWVGADGDCELSVAIRIATLSAGRLLVPVGSGITLASEPAAEYDETLDKARALFDVLHVAPAGTGASA